MHRLTARLTAAAAGLAAVSCVFTPDLGSDPRAYEPARSGLAGGDGGGRDASTTGPLDAAGPKGPEGGVAEAGADPCSEVPPFDGALARSSADATSHAAGEPCLACHEEGGSAKLVFAAAGTIYVSSTSRRVATSGQVKAIGGTTLTVDRCGNFYAVASELSVAPNLTQPYVDRDRLRRMERSLYREPRPGDCNTKGCHDFSGKNNWGVYF